MVLLAGCAQLPATTDLSRLAGVWESAGGFEYSSMVVTDGAEIVWKSSGCLDEASGRSRGTYRDGRLVLSEPMHAYAGREHRVFHHVRREGREYLVPKEHTGFVREESEPFGRDFWWGLRRRLPKPALEDRFEKAGDSEERTSLLEEWASWPVDSDGIDFLVRIASNDASEEVRREAVLVLESAGKDEFGEVADRLLHEAAEAALGRIPTGPGRDPR